MLSKLIPYIDYNTSRFVKKNGLAERVTQTEGENTTTFPGIYKGGEEYEAIDMELSPSYHRMSGPRTVVTSETTNVAGCSEGLTITYPMVLIGCLPIEREDQYGFEELSNMVANELMAIKFKTIRKELNVFSIQLKVLNINSDRTAVWNQEFEGLTPNIPFRNTLFSIGYELEILSDTSCINICCS